MDPEVKNNEKAEEGEKNQEVPEKMDVDEAGDNKVNEKVEETEKGDEEKPEKVVEDEGPKMLDLAFAMDCTGSMGSYIHQAQQNIRTICEEIVSKEQADIRLALVEYRDHPPQDSTFVTRVHNFTEAVGNMKKWLDGCSASGGGDGPEAVADALDEVRKLDWRPNATKICVFIADAPPHGLQGSGDGFPNGCPKGFDPMQVTQQIAEGGIKIYMVGCEPSINPYKEFFMALCHLTGGQYVPLKSAKVLAKVIIGGAQEEMSLQKMIEEVNEEILAEARAHDDELDEDVLTTRVHTRLQQKNYKSKQLRMNNTSLPEASDRAKKWSSYSCMDDVKKEYTPSASSSPAYGGLAVESSRFRSRASAPKMKKRAAPPKASGGGGVTGWIGSIFGKKSSSAVPEEAMCSAPDTFDEDLLEECDEMPAPRPMSAMTDAYGVEEGEVDRAQAHRMVQQAIMTNKLGARKKKY